MLLEARTRPVSFHGAGRAPAGRPAWRGENARKDEWTGTQPLILVRGFSPRTARSAVPRPSRSSELRSVLLCDLCDSVVKGAAAMESDRAQPRAPADKKRAGRE